MFEKLHALSDDQTAVGADALQENGHFAAIVDRSGVFVLFRATRNHEVDFACVVQREGRWLPAPLTPTQYSIVHLWASRFVPRLCRTWKTRHPEDRFVEVEPWKLGSKP